MNNKKSLWSLLNIMMVAILSVSFVSCGGDDDDDTGPQTIENTETSNTIESTEYIATEQVKTITLKSSTNQEYMIYKDYYWKHKLYLQGTTIRFNSYHGGGNGWILSNRSGNYGYRVGVVDCGQKNGITEISDQGIYCKGSYPTSYCITTSGFFDSGIRYNYSDFKPNHGYMVAFLCGDALNLNYMRMYPIDYTLDSNDRITSITFEYQIY